MTLQLLLESSYLVGGFWYILVHACKGTIAVFKQLGLSLILCSYANLYQFAQTHQIGCAIDLSKCWIYWALISHESELSLMEWTAQCLEFCTYVNQKEGLMNVERKTKGCWTTASQQQSLSFTAWASACNMVKRSLSSLSYTRWLNQTVLISGDIRY